MLRIATTALLALLPLAFGVGEGADAQAPLARAVIGGLVAGHYFHHPEMDGYLGILVSLWLLFLGFTQCRIQHAAISGLFPPPWKTYLA